VNEAQKILGSTHVVLIVDWPSRDVPDTLARAGFSVVVKGGPAPDDYSAYELSDGDVVVRGVGHPPERADIVYAHRPLGELPGLVAMAQQLDAKTVWCQSGLAADGANDPKGCWVPEDKSQEARRIVESAGLAYIDDTYIADAIRGLGEHK
jgi:predicted CoA-binding protein